MTGRDSILYVRAATEQGLSCDVLVGDLAVGLPVWEHLNFGWDAGTIVRDARGVLNFASRGLIGVVYDQGEGTERTWKVAALRLRLAADAWAGD